MDLKGGVQGSGRGVFPLYPPLKINIFVLDFLHVFKTIWKILYKHMGLKGGVQGFPENLQNELRRYFQCFFTFLFFL